MSARERSVTRRALSYRRVNVRLRWKRFFATIAPGELGLYTYRAHYLAMIGFGVFGVAHLIEVLERVVEDGCHTEEGAGEGVRQRFACLGGEGKGTEVGLTASGSIG